MSVLIEPELLLAFKVATAAQGKSMSEVLLEFIRSYVKKSSPVAWPTKKSGRA